MVRNSKKTPKASGRSTAAPAKKRNRRTDEQLLDDTKRELAALLERKATKELRQSTAVRKSLAAVRAIVTAMDAAAEESNPHLRHALADAYRPLAEYLSGKGLSVAAANLPRGRRPG